MKFLKSENFRFFLQNFLEVVRGVDVFRGSNYEGLASFIIFRRTDFEIWGAGVWGEASKGGPLEHLEI